MNIQLEVTWERVDLILLRYHGECHKFHAIKRVVDHKESEEKKNRFTMKATRILGYKNLHFKLKRRESWETIIWS